MSERLAGLLAIVTGAASGNGRAIALAFAAEGANVACLDRDGEGARSVAQEIEKAGGRAIAVEMDVTSLADCERATRETVAAFGGLDCLINNAGIIVEGNILQVAEDDWDRQQAINVKGVYLMTKAALPALIQRGGGSIVNIASLSGLRARPNTIAYVTSKHAVVGMTRALAIDCAGDNIRVNAICPGFIETPMTERYFALQPDRARDDVRAALARPVPLGRVGTAEDVAKIAVHLASDEAAWTTGTCYQLDGGSGLHIRV